MNLTEKREMRKKQIKEKVSEYSHSEQIEYLINEIVHQENTISALTLAISALTLANSALTEVNSMSK